MVALLVQGAGVSLVVGFAAAVVSALIGGAVGLLSGYFGGKVDTLLMRITDYVLVIPDVPLMIIVAALFGRSLTNIILIIGAIYWTTTARLVRAQVKSVRERVYVKRARAIGAGNTRIIVPPRPPAGRAAARRQHRPARRARDLRRDRSSRSSASATRALISWGKPDRERLRGRRDPQRAPGGRSCRPASRRRSLILACTMIGHSLEDSLNPRLRVGHLSVRRFRAATARREARRRMSAPLLRVETSPRLVRARGRRRAARGPGSTSSSRRGERFGLVGESGCGKTTAILALMGLLPPNASVAGRVVLDGEDILARGRGERQPPPLARHRHGLPGRDERLQPGAADRRPDRRADGAARSRRGEGGPSPGRRAARARRDLRATAHRVATRTSSPAACASERRSRWRWPASPSSLLADEPTTALDVMVQAQILDLLVSLVRGARARPRPRHARPARGRADVRAGRGHVRGPDRRGGAPRRPSTTTRATRTRASCSRPRPTSTASGRSSRSPACRRASTGSPSGCPFAPRCDSAFEPCASVDPASPRSSATDERRNAT